MVITKTWNKKEYSASNDHKTTASYDEFDTYEEVNEFVDMIMELYKDVPRPTGITRGKWGTVYNVPEGSYFWGFVVLDFDEEPKLFRIQTCTKL